jgi:hypothetical protein
MTSHSKLLEMILSKSESPTDLLPIYILKEFIELLELEFGVDGLNEWLAKDEDYSRLYLDVDFMILARPVNSNSSLMSKKSEISYRTFDDLNYSSKSPSCLLFSKYYFSTNKAGFLAPSNLNRSSNPNTGNESGSILAMILFKCSA